MISITCQNCGCAYSVDVAYAGKAAPCPQCDQPNTASGDVAAVTQEPPGHAAQSAGQNGPVDTPPPSPAPPAVTSRQSDVNLWGMLSHLSALAGMVGIPAGNVVGPLVVWLIKREEFPFVDDQGKESLNFQITMLIGFLICIPLAFIVIGVFLMVALGIANLVLIIMASIEAHKGRPYRYPFSIKFIK